MPCRIATIAVVAWAGAALAQVSSDADFAARCGAAGVVRCIGFEAPSEIAGTYGDNTGILPGATTPAIDTNVKASGAGSIVFTIPPTAGADTSGSYFANFSTDLLTRFGAGTDLYLQWRQRFSSEFLSSAYAGGEGWKQVIIGTGDVPGCTASNSAGGECYSSCSALEVVSLNSYQRGFAEMYNSCTGSTSHGAYDPFEQPFGSSDFKLQNGRPSPYCLYSQGQTQPPTYFPPSGNCVGYFPDEWMTFQVHIQTGPRVNDEFANSRVQMWIAREGMPSELVVDWGPYNLSAGSATEDQRYGKIWLLPYNTNKDPAVTYPTAYTWYDELIVSRQPIADPMGTIPPQTDAGRGLRDGGGADAGSPDAGAPDGSSPDAGSAPASISHGGCGCGGGGAALIGLLPLLLAARTRRRRRGAPSSPVRRSQPGSRRRSASSRRSSRRAPATR